jgi:single-strand DNA-binding protein
MNLNKVFLIGRVTKKPEIRMTPNGATISRFSLVTNHTYKKDNEKVEEAEFHNIVAFGKTAEIVSSYIDRGQLLSIEGRIKNQTWDRKDGGKGYRSEIIAENIQLGPKPFNAVKEEVEKEIPETEEEINISEIPF